MEEFLAILASFFGWGGKKGEGDEEKSRRTFQIAVVAVVGAIILVLAAYALGLIPRY